MKPLTTLYAQAVLLTKTTHFDYFFPHKICSPYNEYARYFLVRLETQSNLVTFGLVDVEPDVFSPLAQ